MQKSDSWGFRFAYDLALLALVGIFGIFADRFPDAFHEQFAQIHMKAPHELEYDGKKVVLWELRNPGAEASARHRMEVTLPPDYSTLKDSKDFFHDSSDGTTATVTGDKLIVSWGDARRKPPFLLPANCGFTVWCVYTQAKVSKTPMAQAYVDDIPVQVMETMPDIPITRMIGLGWLIAAVAVIMLLVRTIHFFLHRKDEQKETITMVLERGPGATKADVRGTGAAIKSFINFMREYKDSEGNDSTEP